MPVRVEQARTTEDVERLAALWDDVAWRREEAEREYLLARVRLRAEATAPFGAFALDGERIVAAVAGRIEHRPLPTGIGYRMLYAPRVRMLQLVDGGVVAESGDEAQPVLAALRALLESGEIDAVAVPPLPVGSTLHRSFAELGGPLERQPFIRPWLRRRLALPESFDEFVAASPSRVRLARYARSLDRRLGNGLAVEITRDPSGLDRFARDADAIAAATYQRAIGSGFADTPEQRELLRISLEHGWQRAYMLRNGDTPVAYWLCSTYRGTMTTRATGYAPKHEHDRVGSYLLLRVIEDACRDPGLHTLDFGPGDADYKRHFSSESHLEQNLLVFAPTFHGRRVNMTRGAILGGVELARRLTDAAGLTGGLRKRSRKRLRRQDS